jgi:hypothetical protein
MIYVDMPQEWVGNYHGNDEKLVAQAKRVGARHGNKWSHLWCDAGEEEKLHEFARKLGLKREWFQAKPDFPHYDTVPTKLGRALALGATQVSLLDWLRARNSARFTQFKNRSDLLGLNK